MSGTYKSHALAAHDYDTQHRRITCLHFSRDIAFLSSASAPRTLSFISLSCRRRHPRTSVASPNHSIPPLDRRTHAEQAPSRHHERRCACWQCPHLVAISQLLNSDGRRYPTRYHVVAGTSEGNPAAHDALKIVPPSRACLICDIYSAR